MNAIADWLLDAIEPAGPPMPPCPVPAQFEGAQLVTIPNRALRELVKRYGQDFFEHASEGRAPLLVGPPGRYKSFSAALLAHRIHHQARLPVGWCDVPAALTELERKRFDPETDRRIADWKSAPWLVMDDFAMPTLGSWQAGVVAEIAMARFDARRPTCWTGNVEVHGNPRWALEQVVGGQVARRIWEGSESFRLSV